MERSHDVVPAAPNTLQHAARLNSVLSCPICLGMMLDPLITACCQNNFCRRCLTTCLRGKPECPLCRASLKLENTLPNRALRSLLPHINIPNTTRSEVADHSVVAFRPIRLSRVPTACLLLLLVFSTAGLITVLFLGSGCLSASTTLRGDGLALSSLAWCCRVQKTETEPDVITAVSDASTRSLIAQGLKHSTSRGEPVLEEAEIPSRSSTHLPSAEPTGEDGAPSGRVARAVDIQAAPHGSFASPFALQPPAPAEGVGMAWRRAKGRQPHGSDGPGPAEAIDWLRSIDYMAP